MTAPTQPASFDFAMTDPPALNDAATSPERDDSPDGAGAGLQGLGTLVTVATYNEIENLPRLAEEIFKFAPLAHLLVVDDNSPDGTGQWAKDAAASDERIHCLSREGKLGLGTAIIAAMRFAIDHGYERTLNLDADFSHPPRYIPDMLALMADESAPVDVVIGSRHVPGGGVEGWPLRRHVMSRAVNLYARWMLGLAPRDCSGSFRCYRTAILRRIDLNRVVSRGYSFQEEILWHLKRAGARFAETPITFADRRFGQSKIDAREALSALGIIFRLGVANLLGRSRS